MLLSSLSWTTEISIVVITILGGIYFYFKNKFKYWDKLGVKLAWGPSIPYGHFKGVSTKKSMGMITTEIYNSAKNEKIVGAYMFNTPIVIIRDLEVVKNMLVKDFSTFHDRGFEVDTNKEPLAGHLFLMNGQEWRNLRIKLTPTFTTGKMRMMFPTLIDVGKQLEKIIEDGSELPEIEIKDLLSRYTTDVIASCAFGIEANSLKNPNNEFRRMGKELTHPKLRQIIFNLLIFIFPKAAKYIPFNFIPKNLSDFFIGLVRETMEYREENNAQRNDFMQLLLELKTLGYVKDADNPQKSEDSENAQKFTVEQAAAQAFLFFFAGFETSSATMQFALYELALNPELQSQAQAELDRVKSKYNGTITYDGLHEMELLDRIVSETLRKYAVANVLIRENNKEYKVPGTDVVLPAQSKIWFPVYAYHMDEKYYPDPEKFDPDRFLPEEKAARPHFAYLPFGEGPRNCIGNRFALMQTKAGLAIILSRFTVSPSKNTPIPIEFDPKVDLLTPKGLIHLKMSKRNI